MSSKAKPADSKEFSRGGRPGRGPGRGYHNEAGVNPSFRNPRPMKGFALSKFQTRPPKGDKP